MDPVQFEGWLEHDGPSTFVVNIDRPTLQPCCQAELQQWHARPDHHDLRVRVIVELIEEAH